MKVEKDEFYLKSNLFVPDISFRHIRVRVGNKFIGSNVRFGSSDKLKKWLHKIQPDDVYFTVGKWMNPELFHGRQKYPGWHKSRRIMIGCDFVVDIDVRPDGRIKTWMEASKNMKLAGEILGSMGYKNIVYVNSGRGYHVYVLDYWDKIKGIISNVHYMDRPSVVRNDMIRVCRMLNASGVIFDEAVSCDPFRVVRVWGSRHNSGNLCYSYSVADLVRVSKSSVNASSWKLDGVMTESLSKSRARGARTLNGVSGGTDTCLARDYIHEVI